MSKIFILTGETSGDKLAASVINRIKKINNNIEYLSVGGSYLNSIGIKSIFNLQEITYIGFTSVIMNILKIRNKINITVEEIIKFKPDVLFSVDSPDFTLRVAEKVKKINPAIKVIHYVAPQVWIWRENRVKKFKKFIDHILLLFDFERKYFDKENILNTFVGHPLLEQEINNKVDVSTMISNDKKIISLFSGSRLSEINLLLPILIDFIGMMNKKFNDFTFVFHATEENKDFIKNKINNEKLNNVDVVSDDSIKSQILKRSVFSVSKSGTISLEICKAKIPSIIIYKMNFLNYLIIKMLVKVKYANIINIINDKEIIPELIQKECNPREIYNSVVYFLKNPDLMKKQVDKCQKTINSLKNGLSSENAANILLGYIKN